MAELRAATLADALAQIKARWITGGSGLAHAPQAWREAVGAGEAAELNLLALVGQATQVAFRPAPGGELTTAAPLPRLAAPSLPEETRPRFRRALQSRRLSAEHMRQLLRLIEARGYSAHPADWAPSTSEAACPDLYAPWLDWRENAGAAAAVGVVLKPDTWASFLPSERRAALNALRARDPSAARALIAEKAGADPADQRLRLVELLATGLSADDAAYLESLSEDRAPKVRQAAARLLARLGGGARDPEKEAALAAFLVLEASGGGPARVTLKPVTSNQRRGRRSHLFDQVSLAGLAETLSLAPEALVEAWDFDDNFASNSGFGRLIARTGADALALQALTRWIATEPTALADMTPLLLRLDPEARWETARPLLSRDGVSFAELAEVGGAALGRVALADLDKAPALTALAEDASEQARADAKANAQRDERIGSGLFGLGLLADQPAAAAVIERFAAAGLSAADPSLAVLQLNASLERRTP